MTDSKIKVVKSEFKEDIADIKTDTQDPGAEMQATQLTIIETSFNTMRAIDGNKEPLRGQAECIERCRKSGGEGFGLIEKE